MRRVAVSVAIAAVLGAGCEDIGVKKAMGNFAADIAPLFAQNDAWYPGSVGCGARGCHHSESAYPGTTPASGLDMQSYAGIMAGANDGGTPIIVTGSAWQTSPLRERLRDNRMPPGISALVPQDGPRVKEIAPTVGWVDAGAALDSSRLVQLIDAWLAAGAPDGAFGYTYTPDGADAGTTVAKTFSADILPLFTTANVWFTPSPSCNAAGCHNGVGGARDLDMGSYAGIMAGADNGGTAIVYTGMTAGSATYWAESPLRKRLRNNRMPWGTPSIVSRDGTNSVMQLVGEWLAAGAPNGEFASTYLARPSADGGQSGAGSGEEHAHVH